MWVAASLSGGDGREGDGSALLVAGVGIYGALAVVATAVGVFLRAAFRSSRPVEGRNQRESDQESRRGSS